MSVMSNNSSSVPRTKTFFDLQSWHTVLNTGVKLTIGIVSFVPNGAILPRQSGASDKPLESDLLVRFFSPPSLEKTYILPNQGAISGMALPAGITTVVGGGF